MTNKCNYYIGRIAFKHQISQIGDFQDGGGISREEKVKELLLEYMKGDEPVYKESESEWKFGDAHESDGYIYGQFGMVFPEEREEYEDGRFKMGGAEEEGARAAVFVIDPSENLIIFNQRDKVRHANFREAFRKGYNAHMKIDDGLEINLIKDTRDLNEVLEGAHRVFEAKFELVPTNPDADPVMQNIDDHIQEMLANALTLIAESDRNLKIDEELLQAARRMCEKGYGDYEYSYEDENGNEDTFESDEQARATMRVKRPENMQEFKDMAKSLWNRAEEYL